VGGGDKSKGAPRDFSACTRFQGPVTRALLRVIRRHVAITDFETISPTTNKNI
jgi:hypothetical protein